MFTLWITIIFIVPLNYELCSCGCAHTEYELDKQCCPMCAAGETIEQFIALYRSFFVFVLLNTIRLLISC